MIRRLGVNDQCIIIPFHVNENHWVVVVRRRPANKAITFYYADDINCEKT